MDKYNFTLKVGKIIYRLECEFSNENGEYDDRLYIDDRLVKWANIPRNITDVLYDRANKQLYGPEY